MGKTVILLGHGSRAACDMPEVAEMVAKMGSTDVRYACLQFCEHDLGRAVREAASAGAEKVIIIPYFLHLGNHMINDIPAEVAALRENYPEVEIELTEHLGVHPKLAEIVLERIKNTDK
ncbi:MAG: sirohydrochlorin chelatase [Nitrospirota bacterium]